MGMDVAVGVKAGVGLIVVRKGRRKVREGRADCPCNQWLRVSGSTVFASAETDSKASDQAGSLRTVKPSKVGVSLEAHVFQPGLPPFPCSFAALVCLILDAVVLCNFSSVEIIHEEITFGSGEMQKFVGICVFKFVCKKWVRSRSERKN